MDDVYGVLARPQSLTTNRVNSVITQRDTGKQAYIMDQEGRTWTTEMEN